MLSILLICNQNEQTNCFIGQSNIHGVQTLHQSQFPSLQALFVQFDKLMETANSKIFHIIVSIIEKLIDNLCRLFNKIIIRIDIAGGLNGLLQDTLTKMKSYIDEKVLEERLVQYRIYFSRV